MSTAPRQPDLPFDTSSVASSLAAGPSRALRVVGGAAAPLGKTQKKFNKLLARVETLRAQRLRAIARWDQATAEYASRIHPLETRMRALRHELVRALAVFWRAPKGLGKRQRAQLRDLMLAQFGSTLDPSPESGEADLVVLHKELAADALAEREARKEAKANDSRSPFYDAPDSDEDFDGDDDKGPGGLDMSKFRPDMTEKEAFEEVTRQMFESGGLNGLGSSADGRPRKPSAAQLRKEQREAELEQARKRGISSIYKQLAKVLHPDLERDPERRRQKEALMQELTSAYQAGDLHTLLRLELEFIHREQGDLNHLSEEKLKIYCELLAEQVGELEQAVQSVPEDPRYAAIRHHVHRVFLSLPDWAEVESDLHSQVISITRSLSALGGRSAREEVRMAIQAFSEHRRQLVRGARRAPFPGFF